MRISDWSSDVCSSDLDVAEAQLLRALVGDADHLCIIGLHRRADIVVPARPHLGIFGGGVVEVAHLGLDIGARDRLAAQRPLRSEEHTSELQSLMRISYAVFCLKKKNKTNKIGR